MPVILAQGGGKLSKRHGATMVREFRERGYLSDALLNFIALLGWALDDKTEFFTMNELISLFDIERVNKGSAIFSYEKLDWFNGIYTRNRSIPELYEEVLPFLKRDRIVTSENEADRKGYIFRILPLIQVRLNHLTDITGLIWFFFDELYEIREPDALIPKKGSADDAFAILKNTYELIDSMPTLDMDTLEDAMRSLVEELGLKTGQVFMTVRVAITGSRVSPGLFETMVVLGRDIVLTRLQGAAEVLKGMGE
jgi:glutamyl-tRNA synthetase